MSRPLATISKGSQLGKRVICRLTTTMSLISQSSTEAIARRGGRLAYHFGDGPRLGEEREGAEVLEERVQQRLLRHCLAQVRQNRIEDLRARRGRP